MRKPITTVGALLLLFIAGVQAVRAYLGIDVIINGFQVPVVASWAAAGIIAFVSLMMLGEARR